MRVDLDRAGRRSITGYDTLASQTTLCENTTPNRLALLQVDVVGGIVVIDL